MSMEDSNARAVFIVGIPFLLINDSRLILKKTYLDENFKPEKFKENIDGNYWYKMSALRDVNYLSRCTQ